MALFIVFLPLVACAPPGLSKYEKTTEFLTIDQMDISQDCLASIPDPAPGKIISQNVVQIKFKDSLSDVTVERFVEVLGLVPLVQSFPNPNVEVGYDLFGTPALGYSEQEWVCGIAGHSFVEDVRLVYKDQP